MIFRLARRLPPLLQAGPTRAVLTLLLAGLAAKLCVWLRWPLPWMIRPLLVTAMLGVPTASWTSLRNIGQWIIGAALGFISRHRWWRWWLYREPQDLLPD